MESCWNLVPNSASCRVSFAAAGGTRPAATCRYGAAEALNHEHVYPILSRLVEQPFFQYFKVNLYCDCPFWPEDGMCTLRDCSVCECPMDEVPEPWRKNDSSPARWLFVPALPLALCTAARLIPAFFAVTPAARIPRVRAPGRPWWTDLLAT